MIIKRYLSDDLKEFKDYQLCYVDTIPETYSDWDERSKALMETEEYKEYMQKRIEYFYQLRKERRNIDGYEWISSGDYNAYDCHHDPERKFRTDMKDYPEPDFVKGYTHYLYFTSDLSEQWGDDWDDTPYEHNAGCPYDSGTNIVIVPVIIPTTNDELQVRFPNNGYINSPYSVDIINAGAIPWIWVGTCKHKKVQRGVAINGGDILKDVIHKLNHIKLGL